MKIISISLDDETDIELKKMQKQFNFKSRSKLLRSALNSMLSEYRFLDSLKGHVDAVYMLTYKSDDKDRISDILHEFEDLIKTAIHQHHVGICFEILVVCAKAEQQKSLFSKLKKEKGIRSVKCSIL